MNTKESNFKIFLFLLVILSTLFFVFIQNNAISTKEKTQKPNKKVYRNSDSFYCADTNLQISHLEYPTLLPSEILITHTGYSFVYSEVHEQAKWVAYQLTREETIKQFERTNNFIEDPSVLSKTANDQDYYHSGYDRGHLAPASDMGWSEKSMAESFYYSNMSPQNASFNRGIWKKLEELVRTWSVENNSLYIVVGPVLTIGLPVIGPDKVSVPSYYFKVLLDYTSPDIKCIGFIIPNNKSNQPLSNYALPIDSLEQITGIDFFPNLPDKQEKPLEKTVCKSCWSWANTTTKNEKIHLKSENTTKKQGNISVQCTGQTKAGNQCKHMTYSPNHLCFQHGGN